MQEIVRVLIDHPLFRGGMSVQMEFTYAFGEEVQGLSGARNIDYTVEKVLMTPLDEAMAANFREENSCGISDWVEGEAQDITGRKCGDAPDEQWPAAGETAFDIISIDNAVMKVGYYDEESAMPSDPSARATKLDEKQTITLLDHKGNPYEYPKPKGKATFNQQKGTEIGWAMWSWNPVTGCNNGCDYC
jgi:hypothetical protein